jgi:dTDP-4-dehydrorhamnose reductase
MKESILITGGYGSLGTAFRLSHHAVDYNLITPTKSELDISDLEACRDYLRELEFTHLINAAAMVNWETCHENPQRAFNVNAVGASNMATLANEHNAKMVHISTDAVFPGLVNSPGYSESDIPNNPVSVYGASKLAAENTVSIIADSSLIVRLGWLFGPTPLLDTKFVGAILRRIANGVTNISAVTDKIGSPTSAIDAVNKIYEFIARGTEGVRHVVNEEAASRHDVAAEIIKLWSPQTTLSAVDSSAFPSKIVRPEYSVLRTIYRDDALGHWNIALSNYFAQFPDLQLFKGAV